MLFRFPTVWCHMFGSNDAAFHRLKSHQQILFNRIEPVPTWWMFSRTNYIFFSLSRLLAGRIILTKQRVSLAICCILIVLPMIYLLCPFWIEENSKTKCIFIPILVPNHWILMIVDLESNRSIIFDSLKQRHHYQNLFARSYFQISVEGCFTFLYYLLI